MTSTNGRIGGVRKEVDLQKLGPVLVIASSLVLAIRTARWPVTHSDGLADVDWQKEVEHSARIAKNISHISRPDSRTCSPQKMCLGIGLATRTFPSGPDKNSHQT